MPIFGNPPFKFLASHLVKDEEFLADARLILGLEEDAFLRLAAALEKADTFINRETLDKMANDALPGKGDGAKFAAIIYRIAGIFHEADMPVNEALNVLSGAMAEHEKSYAHEERQRLVERLRRLVVIPTGFARQFKAQKLAAATGGELDRTQIICDIRPIFDSERQKIEGAFPLAVLRLEYTAPDNESMVLEMRISEKQIETLETIAATAKRKISLIKEHLKSQNIPIPSTKATL